MLSTWQRMGAFFAGAMFGAMTAFLAVVVAELLRGG